MNFFAIIWAIKLLSKPPNKIRNYKNRFWKKIKEMLSKTEYFRTEPNLTNRVNPVNDPSNRDLKAAAKPTRSADLSEHCNCIAWDPIVVNWLLRKLSVINIYTSYIHTFVCVFLYLNEGVNVFLFVWVHEVINKSNKLIQLTIS